MNIALIFAGGTGTRMNSGTIPKQFLKLYGKEIIIYTLEYFESNNNIDAILIVCLADWIEYLQTILAKHKITKVKWIVKGGNTGQDSIYSGLKKLKMECPMNTIVLIHDGVRPLITQSIITQNIEYVKRFRSAITSASSIETVIISKSGEKIDQIVERRHCMLAKAPQSFYLSDIIQAHEKALAEGRHDFIDSASIMNYYGFELKLLSGGYENIKITTPIDYYIFRAIIEAQENAQIIGI